MTRTFNRRGTRVRVQVAGFTLFEILLAVALLAVAVVPMMSAFGPALFTTGQEEERSVFTHQARATLNRVAALGFPALNANQGNPVNLAALFGWPAGPAPAEAAKEDFTFQGRAYTPLVAVTDTSGGAGGRLEITVTVDYVQLKTLKAER